eukprot:2942131-Amphidinium_carterae.1
MRWRDPPISELKPSAMRKKKRKLKNCPTMQQRGTPIACRPGDELQSTARARSKVEQHHELEERIRAMTTKRNCWELESESKIGLAPGVYRSIPP